MGRKHKVKPSNTLGSPQPSHAVADEYNLQQNFKKVKPFIKRSANSNRHRTDQSLGESEYLQGGSISSSQNYQEEATSSSSWDQYTHLDDKITDFQNKNENAHIQIRNDFDAKVGNEVNILRQDIKSKLSTKWYTYTIAALVAIATLFYALSYSNVLLNQGKNIEEIKGIQIQMQGISSDVEKINEDLKEIKSDVKATSSKDGYKKRKQ